MLISKSFVLANEKSFFLHRDGYGDDMYGYYLEDYVIASSYVNMESDTANIFSFNSSFNQQVVTSQTFTIDLEIKCSGPMTTIGRKQAESIFVSAESLDINSLLNVVYKKMTNEN